MRQGWPDKFVPFAVLRLRTHLTPTPGPLSHLVKELDTRLEQCNQEARDCRHEVEDRSV